MEMRVPTILYVVMTFKCAVKCDKSLLSELVQT